MPLSILTRIAGGMRRVKAWYSQALDFEPPEESTDATYPFLLTTGRRLEHYCNGAMTRKTEGLRRSMFAE